ncbi:cell division topological specificity factor MinE [filamentous cyanobacterium LEGE 11480]|uniref:Cell division topological specificity factor n=1 Tax=Romeriopsis navalis LEGE 11480 TaxID=2777977 RepID=A0A928VJ71_9CYAN|nr:cell division topological specificity factor MinE [Romeriopsis navalis]MBE9028647.1 cell division topological specificity factor MinE [Romeriopsis navalis LEGE 11480]
MNLREILDRMFPGIGDRNSRQDVKNRLKLVLAHDRAAIEPDMLEAMRREILEVVSRYVDLDSEEMELSLDSSDRLTVLVANLPIRRVNPEFYTVKDETITGEELPEIELDEDKIGDPNASETPTESPTSPAVETDATAEPPEITAETASTADKEAQAAAESAETAKARLENVVIQDDEAMN